MRASGLSERAVRRTQRCDCDIQGVFPPRGDRPRPAIVLAKGEPRVSRTWRDDWDRAQEYCRQYRARSVARPVDARGAPLRNGIHLVAESWTRTFDTRTGEAPSAIVREPCREVFGTSAPGDGQGQRAQRYRRREAWHKRGPDGTRCPPAHPQV